MIPALRPHEAPAQNAPSWRGEFDVSFSRTTGNQNMSVYSSTIVIRHSRPQVANFDLQLRGRYGFSEVDGERKRAQEFYRGDFRIDIIPGTLGPYVETRVQHDPFKNQRVIANSGAGARYQMSRADNRGSATLRIAVLHSYEDRTNHDEPTQRARWNMEMEGRQMLADGIEIRHVTKYQPLHEQMSQYLLSLDTSLNVRVTNRFSIMFRHEFERDTDLPARGQHPDDTILTAGVSVRL